MSSIWHHHPNIDVINNSINSGTICEQLGIVVTEVGDDFIKGTMPADARTFQPFGVVHGGANVVLAESLGKECRRRWPPEQNDESCGPLLVPLPK